MTEEKPVGTYVAEFNATGLSSGVYFYKIIATPIGGQAGIFSDTKKLILMK